MQILFVKPTSLQYLLGIILHTFAISQYPEIAYRQADRTTVNGDLFTAQWLSVDQTVTAYHALMSHRVHF